MRENGPSDTPMASEEQARRDFLKKAGRFAVLTPPAVTMFLGTSMNSPAIALSVRPGNGWGDENHKHSGPPGQKK